MTIPKKQQIINRRQAVLELSSQGLSQIEISEKLLISQKTVYNDIAWLKKDATEFIKQNRKHIVFEYKQALSNFYQLRKQAWKHFNSTQDEGVKTHLYTIIASINNDIMHLLSIGDMIEQEILEKAKEQAESTKEDMNTVIEQEQHKQQDSQAVF